MPLVLEANDHETIECVHLRSGHKVNIKYFKNPKGRLKIRIDGPEFKINRIKESNKMKTDEQGI